MIYSSLFKWGAGLLTASLLAAAVGCSSDATTSDVGGKSASDAPAAGSQAESAEAAAADSGGPDTEETQPGGSVSYTDYMGHTVDIPAHPQRIIYYGETLGDLLELGVAPVGTATEYLAGRIFSGEVPDIQDVGTPPDPEKSLTLAPDLIITANPDEKEFATLSKVAPVILFDTFAPLEERMQELGVILNKRGEAKQWLAQYEASAAKMWDNLRAQGVGADETAAVFTFYPGNRLFVMANSGLPQALYQKGGFTAPPAIRTILDEGTGFVEISPEVLDEYAADRIFILNAVADEAQESTEALLKTDIWKKLPAVQAGHVYRIDILKATSDAYTLEWLLDELPRMLEAGK
ncbi:ABC transporter substrate-binding protein [Saccharibacillus sp. CPCC 101409]|uniref:ABC transporter substrate-binding protein n=1 Tax=Saccharibacillus sp. CPCC 101409 TaxID=3058041 RepID=UPI002670F1D5|nr:ABC transporter substrate-binding protein [Saccharibacillus sp. CPCC 101409]MDO3411761.1 ABC transporter substrate-binding protein [Saccharibacillus sp. CPCC 101409]